MNSLITNAGPATNPMPSPSPHNSKSLDTAENKNSHATHYDVLKLVFSLFIPALVQDDASASPLAVGGRKQLHALASVCKGWSEPALDCLWHNLPGLDPLLRLHPGLDVMEKVYCPRPIDTSKVERFERYSRRARGIRLGAGSGPPVGFASYVMLDRQRGTLPLLPALRTIVFEGPTGNTEQLGLLSLLLSPQVKRAHFRGPIIFNETFVPCTLPLLCGTEAGATQHLTLDDPSPTPYKSIWGTFIRLAGPLPIATLDMRFPGNQTLPISFFEKHMSQFPSLTSLTLDLHTTSHEASNDVPENALPRLKSLHLINRSHTSLCQCYSQSLVKRATSVTLYLSSSVHADDAFEDTLGVLSTIVALKCVCITQLSAVSITASALHPFLRLDLEEFRVDVWGLKSHEDDNPLGQTALTELVSPSGLPGARHSGRLHALTIPLWRPDANVIRNQSSWGHGVLVTVAPNYPPIGSLAYLTLQMPALRSLVLSLDSSATGLDEQVFNFRQFAPTWKPSVTSALRRLEIADMRPQGKGVLSGSQCMDFALFLDAVFPNLESLSMVNHPERSKMWDAQWESIEEIRRRFKTLRLFQSGGL